MGRAYYEAPASQFQKTPSREVLGFLVEQHAFSTDQEQTSAWLSEIEQLQRVASQLPSSYYFLEFAIPRMGKRADAVIIFEGVIFVVEYKVGASEFQNADAAQVVDYCLDLKNFHQGSHDRIVVPVLVATHAGGVSNHLELWQDKVARPVRSNGHDLSELIRRAAVEFASNGLDAKAWEQTNYKPTPTIIEAAQALYQGHDVREISRSEAGAENLSRTANYVVGIIEGAKASGSKAICFVTGVPGSGKTLAGLSVANGRMRVHDDEHAVFLSGNGPLVHVLTEALARDEVMRKESIPIRDARRHARAFIQNVHHFRDEYVRSPAAPIEKVAIFDEAQRAWSREQTARFMRERRGIADFDMSEPEFLLSVMDRHRDWCVVVCLVGGGQEINTGEVGLVGWFSALNSGYEHWDVYISDQLTETEFAVAEA